MNLKDAENFRALLTEFYSHHIAKKAGKPDLYKSDKYVVENNEVKKYEVKNYEPQIIKDPKGDYFSIYWKVYPREGKPKLTVPNWSHAPLTGFFFSEEEYEELRRSPYFFPPTTAKFHATRPRNKMPKGWSTRRIDDRTIEIHYDPEATKPFWPQGFSWLSEP